jgi:hypothetical protein
VLATNRATKHRWLSSPIMKSPFDLLPSITRGKLPFEPYPAATGVIGLVFRNTDTTYKFFWFLSLLDKAKIADFKSDLRVRRSAFGPVGRKRDRSHVTLGNVAAAG